MATPRLLLFTAILLSFLTNQFGCLDRSLRSQSFADETSKDGDGKDKKDDKAPKQVVDKDGKPLENPFPDRSLAPQLDGGKAWLNTSGEITMKDLRGKVVILDFWTYCCINCMHVLPDLKFLEKKYNKELVVIGVHSAKFSNEKETEAIRRAIVRYEIEHPVINDSEMLVWNKFGVRAWPTVVLIDPEGKYCGYISGEGNRELLDTVVGKLVAYHKAKGTLDETPVQFELERTTLKSGPLKFPGKLLVDEPNDRIFISDSNHNRIVISSLSGKLIDVIGSGAISNKDGSYTEASFDHPQGMELVGDTLYVADTENHLIRTVDLKTKQVATLAGTGKQARVRVRKGPLEGTAINSPWDLCVVDGVLYIAMAGPHQIWRHKLGSDELEVHAGSGREDIIDAPLEMAALAQPSGISSDGEFLYVADSEGSAIRKVAIKLDGKVSTVVGAHDLPRGQSLFAFGDTDGDRLTTRLQHPLHVEHYNGKLYVADAYNHKIKIVDPKTGVTKTLFGDGEAGERLAPLRTHEPAGIAFSKGKMFVADTNNHRIVVVDIDAKEPTASVFEVVGLKEPVPKTEAAEAVPASAGIKVDLQKISGDKLTVRVKLKYPDEYKINTLFPIRAKLTGEKTQKLVPPDVIGKRIKGKLDKGTVSFEFPLTALKGKSAFQLALTYSYCRGGESGLCKIHTTYFDLPLESTSEGKSSIELVTDMPK